MGLSDLGCVAKIISPVPFLESLFVIRHPLHITRSIGRRSPSRPFSFSRPTSSSMRARSHVSTMTYQ